MAAEQDDHLEERWFGPPGAEMNLRGELRPPLPELFLDCRDQTMPLSSVLELATELAVDENVSTVDLSGNFLGLMHPDGTPPPRPPDGHTYPPMPALVALGECFRQNEVIQRLDLSRNYCGDLGQPGLVAVLQAFKDKPTILALNLSANGLMGPEGNRMPGVACLAKQVLPTTNLVHLDLRFNELHAEALKLLSQTINQSKLMHLDLSHNRVAEEPRGTHDHTGVQVFCDRLRQNATLTSLHMSDNRLTNDEANLLGAATAELVTLRVFDLSDNLISALGATAIADFYRDDEHLKELCLSGNRLLDEGVTNFATGCLAKNTALVRLEMRRCSLSDRVANVLETALRANCVLRSLDLNENDLSFERMSRIMEQVRANLELMELRHDPRSIDLTERGPYLQAAIANKLHALPKKVQRGLLSNASFVENGTIKAFLHESVPPTRRQLLMNGPALKKCVGASDVKHRAARLIQSRYRDRLAGNACGKFATFQKVALAKLAAERRAKIEMYSTASYEAEKKRRAEAKAAAEARALAASHTPGRAGRPRSKPREMAAGEGGGTPVKTPTRTPIRTPTAPPPKSKPPPLFSPIKTTKAARVLPG